MMTTDIAGYFGLICQSFAKVLPKKFRLGFVIDTNETDETIVFLNWLL